MELGVTAQRCAAPLPVGETGGAKGKGGRRRGGSPELHKADDDEDAVGRMPAAEGRGDAAGRGRNARSLARARGQRPISHAGLADRSEAKRCHTGAIENGADGRMKGERSASPWLPGGFQSRRAQVMPDITA